MYTEYDYLAHHGILGMKWGVRRYQNKDGSLTPAGKKHYDKLQQKYERAEGKLDTFNRATGRPTKGRNPEETKHQLQKAVQNFHDPSDGSSTNVSRIKKHTVRTLSDDNLNRSINRLRQEKEMKRLMDEVNHPARAAVKRTLGNIASKSAEDVGKKLATSAMEYGIDRALGKIGNAKFASGFSEYTRTSFNAKVKNGNDGKNNDSDDDKKKK